MFAASKTVAQLADIIGANISRNARLLVTRLDVAKFDALPSEQRARLDYDGISRTAILGEPGSPRKSAPIAVLSAGTSDIPVSREAVRTLNYYRHPCTEWNDVVVAALWRLMDRVEEIRAAPIVIVAAGMDAALVSVVGGLVSGAIIAVPTSVGYGVATGGTAALHAALCSCAPGVTVVNIDNGYGAACAAMRIINTFAAP